MFTLLERLEVGFPILPIVWGAVESSKGFQGGKFFLCAVHKILIFLYVKNPFYIGQFIWRGVTYEGTHTPLISLDLFQRVRDTFAGRNKPKYRKHEFAFAGLLRCVHDGCAVTTELQKGRYIYYRCSHGRGKCALPYMREEDVANRLGEVLKDIRVPEGIAARIVGSLSADLDRSERDRKTNLAALQQRLAAIRTRMDQIYEDKLDGKIAEQLWDRKHAKYIDQERTVQVEIARTGEPVTQKHMLTAKRIFELATSAYSLYLTRHSAEQGQLLKSVLLNCATDGVSLWPVYKKPFDMIFERAKSEDWSGREDLNLRPPGPERFGFAGNQRLSAVWMRSDSLVKMRVSALGPHLGLNPSKRPLGTILGTARSGSQRLAFLNIPQRFQLGQSQHLSTSGLREPNYSKIPRNRPALTVTDVFLHRCSGTLFSFGRCVAFPPFLHFQLKGNLSLGVLCDTLRRTRNRISWHPE